MRQHLQRRALVCCRQRLHRIAAGVGEVAQRPQAAYPAQQHAGSAACVAHRIAQCAAQAGVVLVRLELARLLAPEQVLRDVESPGGKSQRVIAQVELQRIGVYAQVVVFVGAEG